MNKEMLKHLVSVINTIAFAQFAVFGYTSLNIGSNLPSNWDQMAIAGHFCEPPGWRPLAVIENHRRGQTMDKQITLMLVIAAIGNFLIFGGMGLHKYLERRAQKKHH